MNQLPRALWNAVDAAAATGGRSRRYWEANGVSIDSRSLASGDLFIALKTEQRDGHLFVGAALERGAAAVMVNVVPPDVVEDAPLLLVDDTMSGLERLGMFARDRCAARRIAITGSVGKTGTKEALAACLAKIGPTHASVASYNNQWGVPLTLARMPKTSAYGVFEIGMNHAGEIAALSPQVAPEIAIITTIAPAHLAFFNSTEEIARAKAEIYLGVAQGGRAIVHGDAPHAHLLVELGRRQGLEVMTFGRSAGCRCRLVSAVRNGDVQRIQAEIDGQSFAYALAAAGDHWIDNSLAILATLHCLDVPVQDALMPLATLSHGAGRGERRTVPIRDGELTLIDESYNASPVAVAAALKVLGEFPGRKVAILGDMLELGSSAPALHADLASIIEDQDIELVLTCGPLMGMLNAAVPAKRRGPHARDARALAAELGDVITAGDTVLVKGSLGSQMRLVVEALDAMAEQTATRQQGSAA